jgi:hypothetical protein
MDFPKVTTVLPFEEFTVETDRTWVDWVREADAPRTNRLKPEALDHLLVLDANHGHMGGLFCSSILAEFGAEVILIEMTLPPPSTQMARSVRGG